MPIIDTEIHFHLSGGAANANPDLSLGGTISSHAIISASATELYDDITGAEALAGCVKYRAFYVQNASTGYPWQTPNTWIRTNTPSAGTNAKMGLDPVGLYSTGTTILDETCAPSGVTFSLPSSAAPLTMLDVPTTQWYCVWTELTVTAGCTGFSTDSFVIAFEGGSDA